MKTKNITLRFTYLLLFALLFNIPHIDAQDSEVYTSDSYIINSEFPGGMSSEAGGVILNYQMNFRPLNEVKVANKGGAFRIDTRDNQTLFQWLGRAIGSPAFGNNLMSLKEDGDLWVRNKVAIATNPHHIDPNIGNFVLAVGGPIGARGGIKVLSNDEGFSTAWPDYVFEDDYQIKDLHEIENFIKKYKHLPDVPSADEINTEGIELVAMDATLLKKIEELTLYIIEQNKRLETQASQLSEQQRKIDEISLMVKKSD